MENARQTLSFDMAAESSISETRIHESVILILYPLIVSLV